MLLLRDSTIKRLQVRAYSGLDKIRPKSGYTVNNVVPCCHACNFAKSNRAQGEFIQWIKRVHDHLLKTAMAEQWG